MFLNRLLLQRFRRDLTGSLLILATLMILWLLISGSADWQHFATGLVLMMLLTLFWNQMTVDEQGRTRFNWHQIKLLLRYLGFLELEILKANFVVAYIVLSPKMPISPGLIVLNLNLKRDLTRVLYANSITLTPGTITVDLEDDRLLVHGMTKHHAFGVRNWYLYDIMKDLEESAAE
ncbi:MAG: Na+/H+ antiporter subunit E [Bacillota bacterium]